jgi:hypothetical protein
LNDEDVMRNAAIVVLMLGATVPVLGEQSQPAMQRGLGASRQQRPSSPYAKLFEVGRPLTRGTAPAVPAEEVERPARPQVVCGMVIVPADPSLDPRMRVTPPQDPSVEYTIRAFEPPICNPDPPK